MSKFEIKTKVTPKASENKVTKIDDENFQVKVTSVPEKGKANEIVIKLLSKYFKTAKSNIQLTKGETSREKTFIISK